MRTRTISNEPSYRVRVAAAGELADLQRAMHSAEDTLAGLHRFLKVPKVTPRRRVIKGSKSKSLVDNVLGAAGDSPSRFYQSAAQAAADNAFSFKLAQRFL